MMRKLNGTFASKDRANEKHEFFTVICDTGKKDKSGSHIWKAQCCCGNEFEVSAGRINRIKSCGCKNNEWKSKENWKGNEVRGFNVLHSTEIDNNGYMKWVIQCRFCHNTREVPSYYLKRKVLSCNCDEWQEYFAEKRGRKVLPNKQSHVNVLYQHYKKSAISRNLEFDLGIDDFRNLIESQCHYCGVEPKVHFTAIGCAGEYAWNGIDRVDNSKGYLISNCVPCCKQCNFAKRTLGKKEFLDWIKRVYIHQFERG